MVEGFNHACTWGAFTIDSLTQKDCLYTLD